MKPAVRGLLVRGLLVGAAALGASLFISGAWLMVGLLIAGKATGARAGIGMMVTLALTAATFVAGIAVVYRGLGRVGLAGKARQVGAGAYGLVALGTLGVLGFMTLVAFNR